MSLKTVTKKPASEQESDAATVLSMKLKRMAPEIATKKAHPSAANTIDDIDDIWDNMPV